MCRIAGIINKNFPVNQLEQMVLSMCNCLTHGGPDDGGIYSPPDANVVLGNRRLALQDLSSAGHQPMHFQERYSITFNGEIYNFPELKAELKNLGYSFTNHTDTEVVLAAYAEWNTRAFERFNGMFALAIWDNEQQELVLARDSSGMKPLYYSTHSGGICFASEIRAFKPIPFLNEENPDWPVFLLAYGHIPEPVTTLKNVKPLHKGCFLKYNYQTGKTSFQTFSFYSYSSQYGNRIEITQRVKNLVEKSVKRHLIADAPIGVFLSGGLDSSVITKVAANETGKNLNTLSLYFKEADFSEKKYQDLLLKDTNCNSFQHLLTEEEFIEKLPSIIAQMDMPSCDGINTWFISNMARRQGLKAVLSGVGGDELFGGYPSFERMKFASALQNLPGLITNATKHSSRKELSRLSYLNLDGIKGIYLFLRGLFNISEIAKQLQSSEKEIKNILESMPVFQEISNLSYGNQASWMEFNMYMQNQLLRDSDVMGMANSVEIRVPFLDKDLVNYVTAINSDEKYSGSFKKQLLIDSFTELIPREIYDRPKMGFSFPFAKWLKNSSFVNNEFQKAGKITALNFEKFKSGNLHWSQLILLLHLKLRDKA